MTVQNGDGAPPPHSAAAKGLAREQELLNSEQACTVQQPGCTPDRDRVRLGRTEAEVSAALGSGTLQLDQDAYAATYRRLHDLRSELAKALKRAEQTRQQMRGRTPGGELSEATTAWEGALGAADEMQKFVKTLDDQVKAFLNAMVDAHRTYRSTEDRAVSDLAAAAHWTKE